MKPARYSGSLRKNRRRVGAAIIGAIALSCVPTWARAAEDGASERLAAFAKDSAPERSWSEVAADLRDPSEDVHVSAWTFTEVLMRSSSPRVGSFISQRNEVNLQLAYRWKPNVKFYTWIRPFYDSIYDWGGGSITGRNGATLRQNWGNNFNWGDEKDPVFRELYTDLTLGPFSLRGGRQIIAWGKSDGVYLLDNISPFNYREPLRFQEQENKIPQWMLNFNYQFGTVGAVQLIWIPKPEFASFPGIEPLKRFTGEANCEHDFEFGVVCLTNKVFVAFDQIFKDNGIVGADGKVGFPFPNTKKPASRLENGAVMTRFDSAIGQLNYSLVYEYKYNWFLQDLPDIGDGEGTIGEGAALLAIGNVRRGQRIHVIGGAADYQFAWLPPFGNNTVLRVETAMVLDDVYFLPNFDAVKKDHYQIMLGFDKFYVDPSWLRFPKLGLGPGAGTSWFFSVQIFSDFIISPNRWKNAYIGGGSNNFDFNTFLTTNGLRDATQQYATLFVGRDLLADQSLNLEEFVLYDPNFGSVWQHIAFAYQVSDLVKATIGYNKIWGRESDPIGSNIDYVWLQLAVGI